ncbi:hypothetical protein AA313_de0208804 [Arthrobotrys entomopaga]|nr:hypothetical protein AA313_de0208804 [Arthrobotrys entomopaga]
MPSFSTIIVSIAAIATVVSASPILGARDTTVCWGKDSNGTDANPGPDQGWCHENVWTEDSFTAPFNLIANGSPAYTITTESHQTFGPWHCCNTCRPENNCIGWQINTDCSCTVWKATTNVGLDTLGVYGGPFQNQSGTFHRGPAFPPPPNLFGNSVAN